MEDKDLNIIRGTTPTITVHMKKDILENIEKFFFTIKQGNYLITKENDDISLDVDNGCFYITLTQEETLNFSSLKNVSVQLRAIDKDGKAIASNIRSVQIFGVLQDGVIE